MEVGYWLHPYPGDWGRQDLTMLKIISYGQNTKIFYSEFTWVQEVLFQGTFKADVTGAFKIMNSMYVLFYTVIRSKIRWVFPNRDTVFPSGFPAVDAWVVWMSLCLIISYQSFNSGVCSGRFNPWKQLAVNSPTVRVSFAVHDGNINPVSRDGHLNLNPTQLCSAQHLPNSTPSDNSWACALWSWSSTDLLFYLPTMSNWKHFLDIAISMIKKEPMCTHHLCPFKISTMTVWTIFRYWTHFWGEWKG